MKRGNDNVSRIGIKSLVQSAVCTNTQVTESKNELLTLLSVIVQQNYQFSDLIITIVILIYYLLLAVGST